MLRNGQHNRCALIVNEKCVVMVFISCKDITESEMVFNFIHT